jgi:hypothetical protein
MACNSRLTRRECEQTFPQLGVCGKQVRGGEGGHARGGEEGGGGKRGGRVVEGRRVCGRRRRRRRRCGGKCVYILVCMYVCMSMYVYIF